MNNIMTDERSSKRQAIGEGLLVFLLAVALLSIAAKVLLLEAMDDPTWSLVLGAGIWLIAIGLSLWQVRHSWPQNSDTARSRRRTMLLASAVMTALGMLSIAVCATAVHSRVPEHHKAFERDRQRLLMRMIELIDMNKHLRTQCENLLESGYTPNEAVATTIVKGGLWSASTSHTKSPMLRQNDHGRWLVLDFFGQPYDIRPHNGSFIVNVADNQPVHTTEPKP